MLSSFAFNVILRPYIEVGASCIDKAIEVVGKADSDTLTNQLVDFLMGQARGLPALSHSLIVNSPH